MEKDRIFFWSILCFILGVGVGSFFTLPLSFMSYLGAAIIIAFLCVFKNSKFILLGLCFFLFMIGALLVTSSREEFQNLPYSSKEARGVFRIISYPEEKSFFQKVIIRTVNCEEGECPKKDILWQAPLSFLFHAGDKVRLQCRFSAPENFDAAFDYRMFLAKSGIGYTCEKAKGIEVLSSDRKGRIISSLFVPKEKLEQALSSIIPEPEAGLAKGLLLGGNDYLSEDLQEKFTRIGLSHMVAVSGYNITLIAQGLLAAGLLFGLWRKHALWAAFCGIVFFILMIGAPASALRAGIMAGVVFAALQAGRLARPTNALLLAAAFMIAFHPLLLRYDLGFQLSFLATFSIVLVMPFVDRFLPRQFFGKGCVEIVLMTMAVELFVLPIILFSFHTFSPLVIIGNFLVLIVPFAMALSFLSAVLFLILPGAHIFFSWMSFLLLAFITRSVDWLGGLQGTSIEIQKFGVREFTFWYIILFVLVFAVKKYSFFRRNDEETKI